MVEAVYLLQGLMYLNKRKQKDTYMVTFEIQKMWARVRRKVFWKALEEG
jgi:hypothetical protein